MELASQDAGPAVRGGTGPLWVGHSDAVELWSAGPAVVGLADGLRLDLIDPGRSHSATTDTRMRTPTHVPPAASSVAAATSPTASSLPTTVTTSAPATAPTAMAAARSTSAESPTTQTTPPATATVSPSRPPHHPVPRRRPLSRFP